MDSSPSLSLFRVYPELQDKIPYTRLGTFPTPVQQLTGLGRELGLDQLYIKRDDLCHRLYGSNKVRKLEFFLGDGLEKGAREVITLGFAGSNHALATAIHAKSQGFRCTAFLLPQRNGHYVRRNLLAGYHFKSNLIPAKNFPALFAKILHSMGKSRLRDGIFPKFIPGGGSSPEGLLGYVNAAFELNEQIEGGELARPDYIYLPLGSTGTMLGLMLGFKALQLDIKVIIGVRVIERYLAPERKMVSLYKATAKYLNNKTGAFPRLTITKKDLLIKENYLGDGYAAFTEKGVKAAEMMGRHTTIPLNGSYTAKALAALIDDADHLHGKVVLFWNTYNSNDLDQYTAGEDYRELAQPFHRYFEQDVQPLDRQ